MREQKDFLKETIKESQKSVNLGGFPVGVLIVKNGKVFSTGISNGKKINDPTSHAEIDAIRKACKKIKNRYLSEMVLYSSSEPCLMCLSACSWAHIPKIIYSLPKNKHPKIFFESKNDLHKINKTFYKNINLEYKKGYEKETLKVINNWKDKII